MASSLYVHIPFCGSICSYCDFKREISNREVENRYIEKIINELDRLKHKFKTIYIGGGTPNILDDYNLKKLFSKLCTLTDKECEFTIELNPEYVSLSQIKIFKECNVNRVSIGVQSLNENVLQLMNRKHRKEDVIKCIDLIKNNLTRNISCDLIYGFNEIKKNDIEELFLLFNKCDIKHISAYQLELKENSLLNKNKYKLNMNMGDEQFKLIINLAESFNFKRYEVSNFAKNNFKSKHNLAYWNYNDWIGIGFGAHGKERGKTYFYEKNIISWEKNTSKLSDEENYFNLIMMNLRLIDGIDLSIVKNKKAFDFFSNKIDKTKLIFEGKKVKLKNINFLNDFLIDLI